MQTSGDAHGQAVLYCHGAASQRDLGPADRLCDEAGVRLLRHIRPGYDGTTPLANADLLEVVDRALDEVVELGIDRVVVMGFSGGGPYALAAGALRPDLVAGVGLLASWAPMDPPHRGLPVGVRVFMRAGGRLPRALLRWSLAIVGLRTIGHVDDVRRVSRAWGFTVSQVVSSVPVAVWHAVDDAEVPVGPWQDVHGLDLITRPGSGHTPDDRTWSEALDWAVRVGRNQ